MVNFSNQSKLAKEDFYKSKDGYIIFTEKYHLKEAIVVKVVVNIAPTDLIKKRIL